MVVPKKGLTINLNEQKSNDFFGLIQKYEPVTIQKQSNGHFLIGGELTDNYTFLQDYYFVLNDHQGYLDDSRTFGLVPETRIIGRGFMLLYSPTNHRLFQTLPNIQKD